MVTALLIQLPIPQLNYGRQTGNIPLAAACLKQAAADLPDAIVDILPESTVSYIGDAALVRLIASVRPEVIGFTVYSWNIRRSRYLAEKVKSIYHPRILFGGPEITADNHLAHSRHIDAVVHGDGEMIFRELLQNEYAWDRFPAARDSSQLFESSPSPYPLGLLEPWVEDLMLLETQRGCPYRCAFCYYNKDRKRISAKSETLVLEAIRWACEHGIAELYLLDPSLNSRPNLKGLLKKISKINKDQACALLSEIRVESVDEELADLLAAAGFKWFEIGLQSTNPSALTAMNRRTDLNRFRIGARLLQQRGITPGIDLIAGLPGDDLKGFRQSVDFIVENGLQDDVQVFPLSVLPGTTFRTDSVSLGLRYEPEPPYPVIATETFSEQELLMAFDYAESRLATCLYPLPDLNVAWRIDRRHRLKNCRDICVLIGKDRFVCKLVVARQRPLSEIEQIAHYLTHPYQIFIGPGVNDQRYLHRMLEILTAANPFIPLELVFLEPAASPDTAAMLDAVCLERPHFLDHEQRYLFATPGNRSVLFTLVSDDASLRFQHDMQRQVYWWRHKRLPSLGDIESLSTLDGILVDPPLPGHHVFDWQHRFSQYAGDYLHVGFADLKLQKRWMQLTGANDIYLGALTYSMSKEYSLP